MRSALLIAASLFCIPEAQATGIGQATQAHQLEPLRQQGTRVVTPGFPATALRPAANATAAIVEPPSVDRSSRPAAADGAPQVVYTYDRRNRLIGLQASRAGVLIHHYRYTLDASGLRTQVEATDADGVISVTRYSYDGVKRLTGETRTRDGLADFTAHYAYDRAGNRTRATVNGITTVYRYDANDRLTSETTASGPLAGTTVYTHDAAGNVLSKDGPMGRVDYVYDDAGNMSQARAGADIVEYQYDHEGLMLGKTWTPAVGEATHWRYVWDLGRDVPHIIEELSARGSSGLQVSARYVFGNGLISETRNGVKRFVLHDGAGDTRALVDTGGTVTDTFAYDAWGNIIGGGNSAAASHLYRGERLDPDLGFYYLRARWMDPAVGRFSQMDSYQGNSRVPASLHKYVYANADPVNHADPTGQAASGLTGQMAAVGIAAIVAVGTKIGIDYLLRPAANSQRLFGTWDAVAITQFRARVQAEEDTDALIGTLAVAAAKNEGHHTIPVYLCGSMDQGKASIPLAHHVAIHAQIAGVRLALESAEHYAMKTIGRHRTSDILRIAQTQQGRQAIAGALYQVYYHGQWLDKGEPDIETVFARERPPFESGAKTSLPWCTRRGGPDR
jgi:RHS repeat-associated protein